jgi:hypothetical protein
MFLTAIPGNIKKNTSESVNQMSLVRHLCRYCTSSLQFFSTTLGIGDFLNRKWRRPTWKTKRNPLVPYKLILILLSLETEQNLIPLRLRLSGIEFPLVSD